MSRLAIAALLALCSLPGWSKPAPPFIPDAQTQTCQITSVHDGDSMRVRCPGQNKTIPIRLAQIDAPELDQADGLKSRDYLRSICTAGTDVMVESRGQDRYKRTLAEVHCKDVHANTAMIKAGHAWVYDDHVDDKSLYEWQQAAKADRLGLWNNRDAIEPWKFRQSKRQAP